MTMSRMQLNSMFVNNMLPEWGRFVILVKLNRGLRDSNYDQLYAYLKQYEVHANENKMILDRFTQHTVDPLSLMSNVSQQQYYSQSSTTPPSTHLHNVFLGRQNRGQGNNAQGAGAAGYGGAQNKVRNANPGQARQVKCYNCNGIGHIARNCTQPKRPQNSEYFKDKMLLMQAQENGVAMDEERLLFLAGGQDNVVDEDVDEQPIQDLALNVDNVFQADNCDAFDSDVDEAPTAQTMFMANLSSADPVYDEASPSYDLDVLSEVYDNDHYQDVVCEHHEIHKMHDDVQPNYVVDSHVDDTSDSNMIPYDQYVKDNTMPVVQNNVSSVPNDAYMMILNDIYESSAQCVSVTSQNNVVDNSLSAELATYKEQVKLYERRARFELTKREQKIDEQLRIVITDRNIKEENLKKELHSVKMQLASTINHNKSMVEEVTSLKKDFKQKENKYLEEFLDMKALKEKASPSIHNIHNVVRKVKQVWKPKQVRQVWKPTGKVLTSVGYQWRPTGRIFTLGEQFPLTRLTKPKVVQIVFWYLDSGCSKHMTGDRSRLRNFVKKFIGTVRFGNDHFGAIMGYGDYVIGDSVISRVYYMEGLGHNLFSVGQFCDSDLEVAFRKHSCYVRDTDGVELIKGSRGSNLYTISVEDMMKSSPICLLSKASKNKSWLWHRRLNHLNFGTINDLARKDLVRGLPRLKFEKDHLCSTCQLGKSKKHTHKPKTENTNLEVLNTLHMDLCGPMRVQTINGKKYILVIVDDYSRFTWVKFLRSKDETPEVVIKFLKQIQVGLNKTIRYIRTDNGREFVNKDLTAYYERVGIFHQKTVQRTPQQNGVVERRNRTLVEAARTMLIFSKALMFL
ncbi:integrase, catalytic region, zinc finger, CCHC-type containing protein [Tanacetum coccineum]